MCFYLNSMDYRARLELRRMVKKTTFIIGLLAVSLALCTGIFVSGHLTTSRIISTQGTVTSINVEVYWDNACTQVVNNIGWGSTEPGDVVTRTVYVKNSGNSPMTLSMIHSDWVPVEAGNYISLSWNREGSTIQEDEVIQAILTLTISDEICGITTHSLNIIIEGNS